MHWRRRLLDAIRSPARVVALTRRVLALWRRGELRAAVARASAQGFDDRRYRAWSATVRATASAAPAPVRGGRVRFALLIDFDVAAAPAAVAELARVGLESDLVLAREADGLWRPLEADAARAPAPLASWLPSLASDTAGPAWLLWIGEPVRVDATMLAQLETAILSAKSARVVYTDDDRLDAAGRAAGPRFKSAWDPERILETNDVGRVLAVDASLADVLPAGRRATAGDAWRCLIALRARVAAVGFPAPAARARPPVDRGRRRPRGRARRRRRGHPRCGRAGRRLRDACRGRRASAIAVRRSAAGTGGLDRHPDARPGGAAAPVRRIDRCADAARSLRAADCRQRFIRGRHPRVPGRRRRAGDPGAGRVQFRPAVQSRRDGRAGRRGGAAQQRHRRRRRRVAGRARRRWRCAGRWVPWVRCCSTRTGACSPPACSWASTGQRPTFSPATRPTARTPVRGAPRDAGSAPSRAPAWRLR